MPKTTVADVIVPEVFNPYVVQQTAELSALYQSGIVATSDELNSLAASGGRLINMPFWNDLDGDDDQVPLRLRAARVDQRAWSRPPPAANGTTICTGRDG